MKLTNELQNRLGNAKSEDEVKKILDETKQNVEDAGVILDDADLDQVAGGHSFMLLDGQSTAKVTNTFLIGRAKF